MQTLNNAELAFLSVIGHPSLTRRVLKVYASKTFLFSESFQPHLNLMWNAYVGLLKKYKEKYGLELSKDIIAAGLIEAVQAESMMPDELKQKCDSILQKFVSGDIPDVEHGERLVRNLIELDVNRKMLSKLNANTDLMALQQSLDSSKRTMAMLDDDTNPQEQEGAGFITKPLRDIRKLARKTVRMPTGINYLDDISSGGGREGDIWLILGKPSGGKSLMCVQYACAQAMLGKNTLWVTYEQSMEGDISERMIANITDTSLDVIRDVGFDNLPEDVQNKFWAAVAGVDDRLTSMDMTKAELDPQDPTDYGGAMSIWKHFKELKAEGQAPKTVILDWFGSMMSKISGTLGIDLSSNYRFLAQQEINTLIKFAKDEKILIIVMHQLDVKAANARPTFLANATHAQDMHNMQNFFDLVAIIGVKDVNNVCYFSNPKARKGGSVVRTLRMIGEKSRFVMEDGWLPNTDGNFYKPGSSKGDNDFRGIADSYKREIE